MFVNFRITLITALMVSLPLQLLAQDEEQGKEEARVESAAKIVDEIMNIPETKVPPALLRQAYAVAVIPKVVKAGLGFGGRFGKGVLTVRQKDNSWSDPAFIKVAGGSWGLQIGISETDLILVFKSQKGVEGITSGKMTLGGDASVAAGPVGRSGSASTDIKFQAEVLSYSRSRGLFAGIALEGAVISIDDSANAAFYGRDYISAGEILYGTIPPPPAAKKFIDTLMMYTPPLVDEPAEAGTGKPDQAMHDDSRADDGQTTEVKTYAVGETASDNDVKAEGDDDAGTGDDGND